MRNQTIEGNVAFGRFGHSVTSLGDLNNDGCDGQYVHTIIMCVVFISVCVCVHVHVCMCVFDITDIAISAPFDDNGKVFIYYGSKSSGLINTTAQQASAQVMLWCDITDVSLMLH